MCGVAAALGGESDAQVARMLSVMAHRGIRSRQEGSGQPYQEGWSVGHVRLPIVGTGEENDQPAEVGPWTVAFVGEVLDFRECVPGAECDLQLVADAWAEDGPGGFLAFDGFWSVVAYDQRNGALHCLVDYLAQKPLYVRDDDCALAVASEPDAVACLGPLPLDRVYLSTVVKWGYCPEVWRTPYEGVRRTCPGEYAVLEAGGQPGQRVKWSRPDVLRPARQTLSGLKEEVELAVRRRVLSSDVPVACLVSGGLDSAIAYTLASRYGDVRAYHVENGEGDACLRVAPKAVRLDCRDVELARGLEYMQEPLDMGSLLPQVSLSDAVGREGYRVCLTGDGADELFGGYSRSSRYDSQASDVWHELAAWHLPRLDRVMMRNKGEVRSPFLARRVAAAALALPRADRTDKRSLRDLFRRDLPAGTADLPKRALRTAAVECDKEQRSKDLVDLFVQEHERRGLCPG